MSTPPRLPSHKLRRGSAGVALGLALTVSVSALNAAPAVASTAHNPHGTFAVTVKGNLVHLHGTAVDPDSTAARVVLRIAARKPITITTSSHTHAWSHWVRMSYGQHRVTAVAVNRGRGASVTLGSRSVTVRPPAAFNPRGSVRAVLHGNSVTFLGRAFDPNAAKRRLVIRLWHNGKLVRTTTTNARTQRFTVGTYRAQGTNNFRVVALNRGEGTANTTLRRFAMYRGYAWITKYSGNQRLAAEMLPAYGWGESQMSALVQMWNRESGWNAYAANPSGAYGIPQSMPGSKMASAGSDWATNPRTQIKWGLGYIKSRYGSPANAWYTWQYQGSY